jgi:hypothetical protein
MQATHALASIGRGTADAARVLPRPACSAAISASLSIDPPSSQETYVVRQFEPDPEAFAPQNRMSSGPLGGIMRGCNWGKTIFANIAGVFLVGVCQVILLPQVLAQAGGYTICDCEEIPLLTICPKLCNEPPKEKIKIHFTSAPGTTPSLPSLSRTAPGEPENKTAVAREIERIRKAAEVARSRVEIFRKLSESERSAGNLSQDDYKARTEKYKKELNGYRLLMKDLRATHPGGGGG